jgi:Fe-S cluster assembly iron-binding protein IscA
MFTLTPAAASAMIDARGEVGAPDDWGIRFFARQEDQPGITFDFVAAPEPDDSLGGSSKLRTYVQAAIHRQLGDATVDYDDADGNAELVIRPHRDVRSRQRGNL